jgi:hypothetical protein
LESTMFGGGTCEFRWGISAAQRHLLQRGERGAREESWGFYRVELWWPFTHGLKRGVIFGERYQKQRERGDFGRVMTGGTRMAVREEGLTGLGWFGGDLGRLAPGCGPSGLLALSFYFFPSVFFFFCFWFLFWVFENAILFWFE